MSSWKSDRNPAKRVSHVAIWAALAIFIFGGCQKPESQTHQKDGNAIYGADGRMQFYDSRVSPALREAARSTVMMISTKNLQESGPSSKRIKSEPFSQRYNLCASEPFRDEPSAGSCSGFLVGPDLVATAGHCVTNQNDCQSRSFVFDYLYETEGAEPTLVAADKVFACKRIVGRAQNALGADYAVIQLDRPVIGRQPLPLNTTGISASSDLAVLGYPSGLPLKIATGGTVRRIGGAEYFTAELDTYAGNSGSAVINTATGLVEGILVRGETDFVKQNECYVSKVCESGQCDGEDVTKSALFAGLLSPSMQPPMYSDGRTTSQTSDNMTQIGIPWLDQFNPAGFISGQGPDATGGLFSGLFQSFNDRMANCRINLASPDIKNTGFVGQYEIDLQITNEKTGEASTQRIKVDTSSSKSFFTSIVSSLLGGFISRCF
jgi:hypothetical protein